VPQPNPAPNATPTRQQVPEATKFVRAEGIWFDSGMVYVATTGDSKIHAYDTVSERIEVIYDRERIANPQLQMPDNLSVAPSGDLFVAENHDAEDGHLDVMLLTPDLVIAPFMSVEGPRHIYDNPILGPSELTGPVFDPSGTRFYVTSQRARVTGGGSEPGTGEVYEITGPFRVQRPSSGPLSPGNPREAGQAIGSGQGRSPGASLVGAALGIEVPRRIAWSTLRRRGLPVALNVAGPARVDVRVFARFVPASRRGRPGGKRRQFRLAEAGRDFANDGPQVVNVRFGPKTIAQLRGRRQALRMRVEVAVGDASVTRFTTLGRPPRAKRRRRRRR
jgi:hypothetical protein